MLRAIVAPVGKGKSTKVFEEIRDSLDNTEDRVLLLTGEYSASYAFDKIGYDNRAENFMALYEPGMSLGVIASWILKGGYKKIYLDGGLLGISELRVIEAMANYSKCEVTVTMQTNRDYYNTGLTIKEFKNGVFVE